MDLLSLAPVPHLYLRASALPCGVGGNKNLSIVSFIMAQAQGRISSCRQSCSTASVYGWMLLCGNVAMPAAAGVAFTGLPASVVAYWPGSDGPRKPFF